MFVRALNASSLYLSASMRFTLLLRSRQTVRGNICQPGGLRRATRPGAMRQVFAAIPFFYDLGKIAG
jgi:hypothetical protein